MEVICPEARNICNYKTGRVDLTDQVTSLDEQITPLWYLWK